MPELTAHSTPIPTPLPPSLYAAPPDNPSAPPASLSLATAESDLRAVTPPVIDPAAWEDFPVFRETFLMYITEPAYNAALRKTGEFLFAMLLEHYGNWPTWTESSTRTELRAAVADLRHLEGFLGSVGREHKLSSLSFEDTSLSQSAARVAIDVGKLADRIERELVTGQGDVQ
jgi:hypothetical protein